jgi:hypothetical protein
MASMARAALSSIGVAPGVNSARPGSKNIMKGPGHDNAHVGTAATTVSMMARYFDPRTRSVVPDPKLAQAA